MHSDLLRKISLFLLIVGGLNWGLFGLFHMDLVQIVFHSIPMIQPWLYGAIGLAAIYFVFSSVKL